MTTINIKLDVTPPTLTHQSGTRQRVVTPKNGKPFVHRYKSPELMQLEKNYSNMLIHWRPAQPLQGALRCTIVLVYPYRKAERAAIVKESRHIFKDTKPDGGNTAKTLEDVLESLGFFSNDSQIAWPEPIKLWGPMPQIRIVIEPAEFDDRLCEILGIDSTGKTPDQIEMRLPPEPKKEQPAAF